MGERAVADDLARQILQAMIGNQKGEFDSIRELEVLLVISNAITIYLHQHHITL
jgi:hypothetical protein